MLSEQLQSGKNKHNKKKWQHMVPSQHKQKVSNLNGKICHSSTTCVGSGKDCLGLQQNQGWLKKNTTVAGFTKRFYTGVFMQSKSFFFLDSAHASKTVSPVTIDLGPKSEPTWVSVWAVLQDVCILRFLCLPDSYGTYWDHARRSFCSPVLHTCYPWAPHLKGPMSPESYVPQL